MKENQQEFTISAYEELVLRNRTHHLVTRDGHNVRVICTNRKTGNGLSVVTLISMGTSVHESLNVLTEQGLKNGPGYPSGYDLLIEKNPPKSLGWVVLYKPSVDDGQMTRVSASYTSIEAMSQSIGKKFWLSEPVEFFEKE